MDGFIKNLLKSGGPLGHSRLESLPCTLKNKIENLLKLKFRGDPGDLLRRPLRVPDLLKSRTNHQTPHKTQKNQILTPKGRQNNVKMDVWGTTFPNVSEIDETLILNDPTTFWLDYWCSGRPGIQTNSMKNHTCKTHAKKTTFGTSFVQKVWKRGWVFSAVRGPNPVSYTHLTLPTNREV